MEAFVKFWGTRGSIPTPASWTRVYGGNTSCVEVRFGETIFICDAGSGIRELGKDLLRREPKPTELHLLITHAHWDHIQGFPFFAPAYSRENKIRIYGRSEGDDKRYQVLSGQMGSSYFPVSFGQMGAEFIFDHLKGGDREIDGVRVRSIALNHPGGSDGYVFEKDGLKIAYLTDNELEIDPEDRFPDPENKGGLRRVPEALVEVVRDADLLIADAQYDDEQYAAKRGWGHSSCFSVTALALRGGVKNLAIFHHDPESTDWDIDAKIKACQLKVAGRHSPMIVFAARESVELKLQSQD